jgi:Acetyltransferase (GNAT) domain
MVTIERRVHRLLRYRKFWFPSRAQAMEISASLRPNDVVRFFAVSPALDTLPQLVEQYKVRTVCINLAAGPTAVLNGMKKRSCRKEIRRAEKMLGRVAIEIGSEKANRDFLAVYNDFTQAKGLPGLSARWIQENATHCETFVLYLDGNPLCSHLLLLDPEASIVRPLYSGSRRLESPELAEACGTLNRYLHWQEMQRYHTQGFTTFDFGGLGAESIARFKLSFGGAVLTQHFYLLSGTRWVATLGKLVYERILRRRSFKPEEENWNENPGQN